MGQDNGSRAIMSGGKAQQRQPCQQTLLNNNMPHEAMGQGMK